MSRLRLVLAGSLVILLSGVAAGAAGLCGGASCCAPGEEGVRLEAPSCCGDECQTTAVGATDSDRGLRTNARPDLFLPLAPPIDLSTPGVFESWLLGPGRTLPGADSPPFAPLRL